MKNVGVKMKLVGLVDLGQEDKDMRKLEVGKLYAICLNSCS